MASFGDTYTLDVKADAGALDSVADALRENASAIDKMGDAAGRVESDVKGATKQIDDLDDKADQTRAGMNDLEEASEGAGKGIDKAGNEAESTSGRFGGLIGSIGNLIGKLTAVAGVAGALSFGAMFTGGVAAFEEMSGAANRLEAQLGAERPPGFLDDLMSGALEVYTDNWGESLGEVQSAVALTAQAFGGYDPGYITDITEQALIMSEVFDYDVQESVRAAARATSAFTDTSATELLDMVTRTRQISGDMNDDLLDTVSEYSSTFANIGFSAEDMFDILNSGAQAGAYNYDVVADAVREFGIRLRDGTSEAALMTAGVEDSYEAWQTGEKSAGDFFNEVISGLAKIEDPLERQKAGVEIFGTKWEDMGEQVMLAMEVGTDAMSDAEGATLRAGDAISRGLRPALEGLWRTAKMGLVDAITPYATELVTRLTPAAEQFGSWLSNVGIPGLVNFGSQVVAGIGQVVTFAGQFVDFARVGGILSAALTVVGGLISDVVGFLGQMSPTSWIILAGVLAMMAAPAVIGALAAGFTALAGGMAAAVSAALPLVIAFALIAAYESDFGGLRTAIDETGTALKSNDLQGGLWGIARALYAIPGGIAEWVGAQAGIDVPGGMRAWRGVAAQIGIILGALPGFIAGVIEKATGFDVGGAWDTFKSVLTQIKNVAGVAASSIGRFVGNAMEFAQNEAWPAFQSTLTLIKNVAGVAANTVGTIVTHVMGFAQNEAWPAFQTTLTIIKNVAGVLANSAGTIVTTLVGFAEGSAWPAFKTTFTIIKNVAGVLMNTASAVVGTLVGFAMPSDWSTLKKVISTIRDAFGGLFGTAGAVVSAIIGFVFDAGWNLLSTAAGAINTAFTGLADLVLAFIEALGQITVPPALTEIANLAGAAASALGGIGGDIVGAISSINPFATGGEVAAGVPIMVGERGRELFIPESDGVIVPNNKTTGILRSKAGGMAAAGGGNVILNGPVVIQGVQDLQSLYDQLMVVKQRRGRRE